MLAGSGGTHVDELVQARIAGFDLDEDHDLVLEALEAADGVDEDGVQSALPIALCSP